MFEFNNEYLFKSIMSMIKEEGDRIVSMGLVKKDVLRNKVDGKLADIVSEAGSNQKLMLERLSDLHSSLSEISLPGDFDEFGKASITEQLSDLVRSGPEQEDDVGQCKCAEPEDTTVNSDNDEDKAKELEMFATINSTLESILYKLGKSGDHNAAYLVERAMHRINDMIK